MAKDGGLDKLSALVSRASQPASPEEQREMDADEAKLAADTEKVLGLAAKVVGNDGSIFDLQILIENCAEELRNQIREQAEEDGE